MLRDQIFTAKDWLLLGTSFFAHPRFAVDYALAHNYKRAEVLHERMIVVLMIETGHEKFESALLNTGCPFTAIERMTPDYYPDDFRNFSAVYCKELQLSFQKRKLLKAPFRPRWLNSDTFIRKHADEDDNPQRVLQALTDHYLMTGQPIF